MPVRPRLAWQVIRVYLPVRAQCTQCSEPATRSPVSSNPATSDSAIRSVTSARNPSQMAPTTFWDERNTGTNLPAQIELYAVPGQAPKYELLVLAKGGGSANK